VLETDVACAGGLGGLCFGMVPTVFIDVGPHALLTGEVPGGRPGLRSYWDGPDWPPGREQPLWQELVLVPRSGRPEPRCLRWGGLSAHWETASAVIVALEGGLPQVAVKKQGAVELDVSAPLFDSATSTCTGHGGVEMEQAKTQCSMPIVGEAAPWPSTGQVAQGSYLARRVWERPEDRRIEDRGPAGQGGECQTCPPLPHVVIPLSGLDVELWEHTRCDQECGRSL